MATKSFQIIDLISDDIIINKVKKFCITIYGKNENHENIACHVLNYLPYFYLKVPDTWLISDCKSFLKRACKNCKTVDDIFPDENNGSFRLSKSTVDSGKDFYNLSWNKESNGIKTYKFLKACFTNLGDMKKVIQEIRKFYNNDPKSKFKYSEKDELWRNLDRVGEDVMVNDSNLYESSLHPIIRFIHERNINPTGWVKARIEDNDPFQIFPDLKEEFTCLWTNIEPIEDIQTSHYNIASFDIECDSLTGDFPMAQKDFKKFAASLFDSYKKVCDKLPGGNIQRKSIDEEDSDSDDDIVEDTNYLEDITKTLILMGFEKEPVKKSLYKYADIQKLKTKGKKEIHTDFLQILVKEICEIPNLIPMIQEKKPKNKDRDAIINKIKDLIDDNFVDENDNKIELEGDPIIQIGTVFHKYGVKGVEAWRRHILVIAPEEEKEEYICNDLENIEVVRCQDEKELLLQWSSLIQEEDPDFITGYNIFGFDFQYIKDRVDVFFPCPYYSSGKCMCNQWGHHDTCPKSNFYNLGKLDEGIRDHRNKICTYRTQDLNSSALGENKLCYFTMDGRILFDIQKEVEKGHSLDSYKLDNVAANFMRGKFKEIEKNKIKVDTTGHLKDGDYISFKLHSNIGEQNYLDGKKFKIDTIIDNRIYLEESLELNLQDYHKIEWCLNKDDISPQDIFDKHKLLGEEGAKGRAEVAKYCIQDCELCINLLLLLDIIPNNLAMANVSYVPASYIFLRGQGVKVTSVVTKECSLRDTRIPELVKIPYLRDYVKMAKNGASENEIIQQIKDDSDWRQPNSWELKRWLKLIMKKDDYVIQGYEGAIVLDPTPGIYLEDPVAVLDYASLYPSSIIEKNISHETFIEDENLPEEMDWKEGKDYHEIEYVNWIYKGKGKGDTIEKVQDKEKPLVTCKFLTKDFMQRNGMEPKGIIPSVLDHLLEARNDTKKRMKKEPDEFKKKILDGLQLAYKVTANSVYGQLGAKTSTIFKMELAACTTSVGRERLTVDATDKVKLWAIENNYEEPEVVYGDTDSVFVKFSRKDKHGNLLEGKEALEHCIKCGQEAGQYIKDLMDAEGKQPQVLEYEKTFWPFILISKKRYTGDKYEFEPDNPKRTAMGIVLKRRDNAYIVKHVFGHVIEKIMIEKDFDATVEWLKKTLQEIRDGKFSLSYFVISKSLRGYYKNPQGIAHKVLADRMAERDPGNKPKANDRIPYAYIEVDDKPKIDRYKKKIIKEKIGIFKGGKKKGQIKTRNKTVDDIEKPIYKKTNVLQGDRIEHIDYIKEKGLKIDYEFYITNQIMNPVKQVLDLQMDPKETEKLFLKDSIKC